MNDNIESHDPVVWKAILVFICTIATDAVLPWTYHVLATLSTMVVCYFAFNWVRNFAAYKASQWPWIKPFLHQDKPKQDKETIDELTEQ